MSYQELLKSNISETNTPTRSAYKELVSGSENHQIEKELQVAVKNDYKATKYNDSRDNLGLDSTDFWNAVSVSNAGNFLKNTLKGIFQLGGMAVQGAVGTVKDTISGDYDSLGKRGEMLGDMGIGIAKGMFNNVVGTAEGLAGSIGLDSVVRTIDSGADDRVNGVKSLLSEQGAFAVGMDLLPVGKAFTAGSKLSKVNKVINSVDDISDASKIAQRTKMLDDLVMEKPQLSPILQTANEWGNKIMNPIKSAKGLGDDVAQAGVNLMKGEAGLRDKSWLSGLNEMIKSGDISPNQVYKQVSEAFKGLYQGENSTRLAGLLDELDNGIEFAGGKYQKLNEMTGGKNLPFSKGVLTNKKGFVDEAKTIESHPLLSSFNKNGISTKLHQVGDDFKVELTSKSGSGFLQKDLDKLEDIFNARGILKSDMPLSDFHSLRVELSKMAYRNKITGVSEIASESGAKIRQILNDTYRGKADDIMKGSGESLSKIDSDYVDKMKGIQQLKESGVLNSKGEVSPSFARDIGKLDSKGRLTPELQSKIEDLAEALGKDPEQLRRGLVYESTLESIVKFANKDSRTGLVGSIVAGGGVGALGFGAVGGGVGALGLYFAGQALKAPSTMSYLLKFGLRYNQGINTMSTYMVDLVVNKMSKGIALSDKEMKMSQILVKEALSNVQDIGYSMVSIYANDVGSGQTEQMQYVPPAQNKVDFANFIINK